MLFLSSLDRKLVRDLLQMKGQAIAICLVIASGVGTLVMSLSTLASLKLTQEAYYDRYRFAHVFARLKRAPNPLAERIAEIPGVTQVRTRVVQDVTLDIPNMSEPAVGRLISLPLFANAETAGLHLRSGRFLEPGMRGQVIANEAFCESHKLNVGDKISAVINGRKQQLHIVGVALSPEYILQIREGEMLPDKKRFGVFWTGYEELASAFDMQGAFNDVTLLLMRGASENDVLKRLDTLLEPYGAIGAYGRVDQISNRYLTDEMRQLRNMAIIAPSIFLGVSAFLLNVVLSRQVNTQREQIAALKAFGYTNVQIGWHYLKLVLLISICGVVIGTIVGYKLGQGLTQLYTVFYKFPILLFDLNKSVVVLGVGVSFGSAILGTLGAVRRAASLPPAEAMRPEAPATFRPTMIERLGIASWFSQSVRMIFRQLERRPIKSLSSCIGIAMSASVLILGSFTTDALDFLLAFQFYEVERHDMMVNFIEPTKADAMHEVEHLPGVIKCEPVRAVAARLRYGHHWRRHAIIGLPPDLDLYQLLDKKRRLVNLPPDGLVMSEKLAEIFGVKKGDMFRVEVLEGERSVFYVPVLDLVSDYWGTNCYMNLASLRKMLHEGDTVTGAYLRVDSKQEDKLYSTLKQTPRVAGVLVKRAAIQSFNESVADNLGHIRNMNVMFACVIAFGVVYNTARISLSERSRELATLRVIGFTRGEISGILLGELAILTLVALPLGLVIGYGFVWFAALTLDTEYYRIPPVINMSTYAFATIVVIVATFCSGLVVRRKLDHLDLVSVLKSKE